MRAGGTLKFDHIAYTRSQEEKHHHMQGLWRQDAGESGQSSWEHKEVTGNKCPQSVTKYKNHVHSLPSKPNIKVKSQSTKLCTIIPPLGGAASFPRAMVWLSENPAPSLLQTKHKIQLVSETTKRTQNHWKLKNDKKIMKKRKMTSQKLGKSVCLFWVLFCFVYHFKTGFLCSSGYPRTL